MNRLSSAFSVVLVLVLTFYCGADSRFNVDVFWGWGGCYRPMEWTPLEIGISKGDLTRPFAGSVIISARQDGLNIMNITHTFVLTPDIPLHVPLVTKLAFSIDKCNVRIVNDRGRTRWHYNFDFWNFSNKNRILTAVGERDLLIGLVGRRQFRLLHLPKQSVCRADKGQTDKDRGKVYLKEKLPRMVPWDWTGFVCLDLLILYDPDWNMFNQHQLNAISQWVSNGGRLLLIPGSHPISADNPIARLLPFEVHQARQISLPPETLRTLHLTDTEPETVICSPVTPKTEADVYRLENYKAGECLFAVGYVGFGRVGVLTFDPSALSDKQKTHSTRFWVHFISATMEDTYNKDAYTIPSKANKQTLPAPAGRKRAGTADPRRQILSRGIEFLEDNKNEPESSVNEHHYTIGQAQNASNAVMEHLYSISELRPLSIWWVILLLVTLAVLLGPADYMILKRLDRLPMTWLTSAGWIILFSVGAYYGVQALRGGKMQFRAVSVLDGIENSDYAWSCVYSGLFAPYSADYKLNGLLDNQWFSGIAPAQEHMYVYSRESGGRNIYCLQHDGGNLPYSLPINIWSMQCLLLESPLERLPINAEVKRRDDEIILTITNKSGSTVKGGYVLFDNSQMMKFDRVPPGETKVFTGSLSYKDIWRSRQGHYMKSGAGFRNATAFFAQGCLQRTRTIQEYLTHGAAVVCTELEQAPMPFAVKDRKCDYNHRQLVRLVVFPQPNKQEAVNDSD